MKQLSEAMLDALRECGELEDGAHCRTEVESFNGLVVGTWLKGGTTRDKTTYSACMEELWGVIDNPRYLLIREKSLAHQESVTVSRKYSEDKRNVP